MRESNGAMGCVMCVAVCVAGAKEMNCTSTLCVASGDHSCDVGRGWGIRSLGLGAWMSWWAADELHEHVERRVGRPLLYQVRGVRVDRLLVRTEAW